MAIVNRLPVNVSNPNLDSGIQTVQVLSMLIRGYIKPLLQRGVFVEIQFYLRRKEQGRDHLLPKGPLSFYVFLFFDKSAQLRYRWAFGDNREILNLAVGQMEFVVRAGYERGTPVKESPVLLVVPTVNFRPTDDVRTYTYEGATGSTFDAAAFLDLTVEVPETEKDVETENAGSVERLGTKQSGNKPIEGADKQMSSDRGLLRKRRKHL
ncbi:hypothetical protein F4804DRAFT_325743 [Jackrogersella minutella]|nr:hypothetical protein F4804DRAFT_325743 [Jackrogersella minutella]